MVFVLYFTELQLQLVPVIRTPFRNKIYSSFQKKTSPYSKPESGPYNSHQL